MSGGNVFMHIKWSGMLCVFHGEGFCVVISQIFLTGVMVEKHKNILLSIITPVKKTCEITTQNPSPRKTHNMPDHFMCMKTPPPRHLVRALLPSTRRGCVETSRDSYVGRNPLPKLRTHKTTCTT